MLIGEYSPSMDEKFRFIFPAKLREALGDAFIITKGPDNCLACYARDEWAEIEARLRALPMSQARGLQRVLFGSASEVEPDKQGRILIPPHLREHANLRRDIKVIGAGNHAEIWDAQEWERACADMSGDNLVLMMDKLGF